MSSPQWCFDLFRLDPVHACLWCGSEAIALPPKALAVLHYLVTHPDRLVAKDELLDAVWPEVTVTDAVLRVAIGVLRKALGDTRPPPRFIATVPRRGYRFLAPVTLAVSTETLVAAPSSALPLGLPPLLVEREAVLQQLHRHLTHAQQRTRQVVVVTGEPGIGKTAVVEMFAAQAATQAPLWVASGQCVEHYGPGEAYLPVLEALGHLCHAPKGGRLGALMRQQAPTWLVQMPWLLTEADRARFQHELYGATRERMLREFAELVETLTAETSLVLILEDLHWSDTATLDLLALLARRRTPARLLVLGTYRPGEALVHPSPLRAVMQDLQQHGYATELPLAGLSAEAVAAYLAARFPPQQYPAALAPWLHARTDGHPLFLVTLVQALVEQGVLHTADGRWTVPGGIEALVLDVPANLRQLLAQQLTRLAPEVQRVLEVASVAGVEFVAAAVAAGLAADVATIEEHCEALVGQQLLQPLGVPRWPNGTVATRYAFRHALYQQGMYERLGAGQRVRLHQRLGAWLEAAYGAQAGEMAAELAEHFARGHETQRAVHYLRRAAENAAQRYAPRDVIALLSRALALLGQLPDTPARTHHELDLQLALGPALVATKGVGTPEVKQTYARARALCAQVGDTPQLFPTLWGLCRFYRNRGVLPTALELGEQLVQWAESAADPTHRLEAHDALGTTLLFLGDYAAARTHLEQGIALTDVTVERTLALRRGLAPGVRCLAVAANTLWCMGFPVQAVQRAQEALALAQALAHPLSLTSAQFWAAWLHYRRREAPVVQALAEALLTLATAHGFPLYVGYGTCWQSWALAMQGEGEAGLAQLRQGLAAIGALGQELFRPLGLVLLAEAAGHVGQVEDGLHLLAEALTVLEANEQSDLLAEAYRLLGTLLLRQAAPDAVQAEACFQQALAVAHRQQARFYELRTALSLSRLGQQQGKCAEVYALLAPVYGWFTEGFDTADLQEAKALLEELGGH